MARNLKSNVDKWDNWRICNKPQEANSSLSGLTYIFPMSTVNKMKHFERFKLLRIFPALWPVWAGPWNWSKHAFGKWEKPHFQTKRKCKAEKIQTNVGIWKRKDCIHYSHQGCTGNMNSSNYINNNHLFQQIPPVMFPDVDGCLMMNDYQHMHFLSDCPKYVSDERIKFWFLKTSGL